MNQAVTLSIYAVSLKPLSIVILGIYHAVLWTLRRHSAFMQSAQDKLYNDEVSSDTQVSCSHHKNTKPNDAQHKTCCIMHYTATLSIHAINIIALSISIRFRHAKCRNFIVMLSVVMHNIVILSVLVPMRHLGPLL